VEDKKQDFAPTSVNNFRQMMLREEKLNQETDGTADGLPKAGPLQA
jgi:hypothetical protein